MVGLRRGAAICACAGTSAVVLLRLIGEREKGGSGRAVVVVLAMAGAGVGTTRT